MSRRHDTSGPFDPVRQRPPRRAIDSYAPGRASRTRYSRAETNPLRAGCACGFVGCTRVAVARTAQCTSTIRHTVVFAPHIDIVHARFIDSAIAHWHCAPKTDDWWSHGGRRAGCICMCSIYFDFWATSFSLYEWLSAEMQGTLSASATASARLLFVPSRAQLESLPKDEKSTPEDERNRAEWQREVHRIRRTLGSVLFLRAGKGVRASISLRNSSCRILMQFCRIAVRVIVIGAKDSSHASQERTVVAARRRSMTHR